MTTPAHTGRKLFMTLPVTDVARSTAFFTKLGFEFDPNFSDGADIACMIVNEHTSVMLGSHEKYAEFAKRPMADPTTHGIALYCFGVDERADVDTVVDAAVAGGAEDHDDAEDHGFMYSRSFYDLDGHGWQVMWMDPAAING